MLQVHGWELTPLDVRAAFDSLIAAARAGGGTTRAIESLRRLLDSERNHYAGDVKSIINRLIKETESGQ